MLPDYEKLGAFYLGRTDDGPFLYDARSLLTHALIVGMTGSGKTGLGVAMLEEAAIDGVPCIVIDPKGDLANLCLTFPELRDEDFAPWVPDGADPAVEAAKWRDGLAAWDQDGARIQRLREAAEVHVYTPGSRAAAPISLLGALSAPKAGAGADELRERVRSVATSLLALVGLTVEPGQSREHVLLANLLASMWAEGHDVALGSLVARIQEPGFERVGVVDLESFFPKKDRVALSMRFNNLLASPGFEAWLEGDPLDFEHLLRGAGGKPRVSILSIAHLGDAERMFFVSLVLGQLVSWMRAQSGTSSLRAMLFMDEVVGFFPPVAEPPSKASLLLLLKQARAVGLGVVLATQNPVDVDHKGLSNAGTWFIGRLQSERDKLRVMEGLEGAVSAGLDRAEIERRIAGLGKRRFLVHDVRETLPTEIETRWTLSYLRGPLSREHLRVVADRFTEPRHGYGAAASQAAEAVTAGGTIIMPAAGAPTASAAPPTPAAPPDGASAERPLLANGVPEVFFPAPPGAPVVYEPIVVGAAQVSFEELKTGLDFAREVMFVVEPREGAVSLRWEDARWVPGLAAHHLSSEPAPGARFVVPKGALASAKSYATWTKSFTTWLARTQGIARLKSKAFGAVSEPNEPEAQFRARLALLAREDRDAATDKVRAKYTQKLQTLGDRVRKAAQAVSREHQELSNAQRDAAIGGGAAIVGAFFGRSAVSRLATGAATTARRAGRAAKQAKDLEHARANLVELQGRLAALEEEARAALSKATERVDPLREPLETVLTKPKRSGVIVHLVALGWRPRP
jgi:hypothetical protein